MRVKAGGLLRCLLALMWATLPGSEWAWLWGPEGGCPGAHRPCAGALPQVCRFLLPWPSPCGALILSPHLAWDPRRSLLWPQRAFSLWQQRTRGDQSHKRGRPSLHFHSIRRAQEAACAQTWPGLHSGFCGVLPPGCLGTSAAFKV